MSFTGDNRLPAFLFQARPFSRMASEYRRQTSNQFRNGRLSNPARPIPHQLADSLDSQYAWQVASRDESFLDEQRERRRLAANYADMPDGELQRLAGNAECLTELAWDALEDEMDRRHLELAADPAAEPRQHMEMRQLVTIRQFRDLPEALLAKGSLESSGIECFLADENLVRLDWFISNFIGGIKLNVRAADAENAQKLLDEPILEGLYVQGVGLYEQPRCPKCQSLDVNFQELDRPIAYMSAFLRVPLPVQRPAWRCHVCYAEWEDDGAEGSREIR
jgi:Putative prokaryotic signal transducing protein